MEIKKDKEFQDYLDDLCASCFRSLITCNLIPGIRTVNRGIITIECNKYACVTMPEPKDLRR